MERTTADFDHELLAGEGIAGRVPRPSRVLVVRDESLRDQVDRAITITNGSAIVARVPSFLAAMGDLAHQPADAVIGPIDAVTGMLESTGKALRDLAPEARLILTATDADRQAALQALRVGFDAALVEPYDTNELAKALHLKQGGFVEPHIEPVEAIGRDVLEQEIAHAQEPARQTPEAQHRADALQAAEDQPGDVDLIDHLLMSGHNLSGQLVTMIAAQSGLGGLRLLQDDETPPDGCVVMEVSYAGTHLGRLAAPPPATEDQLRPWAAWASRWLAMQDRMTQLRNLSLRDELTGVWNRRYFDSFLKRIIGRAHDERQQVTLLVFDIDDFKTYNDGYGHAAGDEILCEAARLMQSVVREHDVVARIGGDEFAVIFWDADEPRRQGSKHPNDVMRAARRFQKAICEHRFPKLLDDALGTLTISGGLASYPWDGSTPEELLERADHMALQSKQQGKNAITFGSGAVRDCDPSEL